MSKTSISVYKSLHILTMDIGTRTKSLPFLTLQTSTTSSKTRYTRNVDRLEPAASQNGEPSTIRLLTILARPVSPKTYLSPLLARTFIRHTSTTSNIRTCRNTSWANTSDSLPSTTIANSDGLI